MIERMVDILTQESALSGIMVSFFVYSSVKWGYLPQSYFENQI